ncbi:hypothetical protein L1049_018657 [Liquidambar formosana]|uniref:Glucan endo-1,3-beta-D-glucosidase n=1 Tax=Liquidambar formosana TaxID=63359 RepID=A0AAP0RB03_LIQFO
MRTILKLDIKTYAGSIGLNLDIKTYAFVIQFYFSIDLERDGDHSRGARSVGACYGRNGNNLPIQADVVALYNTNGIGRMRIYDPDTATLQDLRGSDIELILDVPKDSLQSLGSDASAASQWVQNNIVNYADVKFKYIAVRWKRSTTHRDSSSMRSPRNAKCSFSDSVSSYITPIMTFLVNNGSPLLANVYTYFSYVGNLQDIQLSYASFTSPGVVMQDGNLGYQNLFDAVMDALYSALEKAGGSNVAIMVSESGWLSEGSTAAMVNNAGTYYRNLINHVKGGTPKKSGQAIGTYLFAMFNENLKAARIEQHFGLFTTDKQSKYQLTFT